MESFIRFWRLLPRFLIGLLFLLLLAGIPWGREMLSLVHAFVANAESEVLNGFGSSVLFLLAIGISSSVGLMILEVLVSFFGGIGGYCLSRIWKPSPNRMSTVACIVLPINNLLLPYFETNKDAVIEYYYLKSWAMATRTEHMDQLAEHMKRITKHLESFHDTALIEQLDYYHSVTQEQVKRDNLREQIHDVYYLIILVSLAGLVGWRYGVLPFWGMAIAIILISTASMPLLYKRRLRLLSYTVTGYMDAFTAGVSATVEDRDAI